MHWPYVVQDALACLAEPGNMISHQLQWPELHIPAAGCQADPDAPFCSAVGLLTF